MSLAQISPGSGLRITPTLTPSLPPIHITHQLTPLRPKKPNRNKPASDLSSRDPLLQPRTRQPPPTPYPAARPRPTWRSGGPSSHPPTPATPPRPRQHRPTLEQRPPSPLQAQPSSPPTTRASRSTSKGCGRGSSSAGSAARRSRSARRPSRAAGTPPPRRRGRTREAVAPRAAVGAEAVAGTAAVEGSFSGRASTMAVGALVAPEGVILVAVVGAVVVMAAAEEVVAVGSKNMEAYGVMQC